MHRPDTFHIKYRPRLEHFENSLNYLGLYLRRRELRFSQQSRGGQTRDSGMIELLVVAAV